jgi:hypothetical protein
LIGSYNLLLSTLKSSGALQSIEGFMSEYK